MRKRFLVGSMVISTAMLVTGCGCTGDEVPTTTSIEIESTTEEETTHEEVIYEVKYDCNGGEGVNSFAKVPEGKEWTITDVTPVKEGNEFIGWCSDVDGNGEIYQPGDVLKVEKSETLYAIWKPITYTITYHLNGGITTANPSEYTYGDVFSLTGATKYGYTFKGWYADADYINRIDSISTSVSGNLELYAKFEINNYELSLDLNGGKLDAALMYRLDYATKYRLVNPTREHYYFDGWITQNGSIVNENNLYYVIMPDSNCELKATWKEIVATDLTLSESSKLIDFTYTNNVFKLNSAITPLDVLSTDITWTSSDETVAKVYKDGSVVAMSNGTATITATTKYGVQASCLVTCVTSPTDMYISDTYKTLDITDYPEGKLSVSFDADVNTNNTVTWTSSDETVAKVDSSGKLIAVSNGNALITASTPNGISKNTYVTVQTSVSSVALSENSKIVDFATDNDEFDLAATLFPVNANIGTDLTWSSSNEDVVTVDENGKVKAIANGEATVMITSSNGKTASCSIIARRSPLSINANDTIYIDLSQASTSTIEYTFDNENVNYNNKITYVSDNTDIVKVDENGVLTGIAMGTANITLTTTNGITKTIEVIVGKGITDVDISDTSLTFDLAENQNTYTLTATISPDDTTFEKTIKWSSSDNSVASVDSNGVVTAVNNGTAIITATSVNGVKATCTVTVRTSPKEIIADDSITLDLNNESEKNIEYSFDVATVNYNNNITFTSSDEEIVTVDENGLLKAIKTGTATIYLETENGITKEIEVSVIKGITSISLDITEKEIDLVSADKTVTLIATISPEDDITIDDTITWTSSDENIASVTADGVVTVLSNGTAIITAKTSNGKEATCSITGYTSVTDVYFTEESVKVNKGQELTLDYSFNDEANRGTEIIFSSEDTSVIDIVDGVPTAVGKGTTVVTITTEYGYSDTITVTVVIPVTSIIIENETISLDLSSDETKTAAITYSISPEDADEGLNFTFESEDDSIVSVNELGVVVALATGETRIKITNEIGLEQYCRIIVTDSTI